jgi:hypothetical protein
MLDIAPSLAHAAPNLIFDKINVCKEIPNSAARTNSRMQSRFSARQTIPFFGIIGYNIRDVQALGARFRAVKGRPRKTAK